MNWLIEKSLGLPGGFLSRQGDLSIRFSPVWPWQDAVGAASWNVVLIAVFAWLIVSVYRRDARKKHARLTLGLLRGSLVALVLLLLNRPVLTLSQNRVEPSVLALMLDDSLSMNVKDAPAPGAATTQTNDGAISRLDAARNLLSSPIIAQLAKVHEIRLFKFDRTAEPLGTLRITDGKPDVPPRIADLHADAQATAVAASVGQVSQDLAGQRVAGVLVLTDGRDAPARESTAAATEGFARLRDAGMKVFPIEIGSDSPPRNLSIQNIAVQDSAFKGDLVSVRVSVRGAGYRPGQRVLVKLVDGKTGRPLPGVAGTAEAQASATLENDGPVDVEVPIKPDAVGDLDVKAVVSIEGADVGAGEIDASDNTRTARVAVLDTKVTLLYVEGYPRWDYRFLRTQMMRDKTVDVSILLTDAEEGFSQDGDKPIRRFPENMEELLAYDAIILGDVDPRQFTDRQLQLISDFVAQKGGGLAMIAGSRWSPMAYRGTVLEPLLPVSIAKAATLDNPDLTTGFRLSVTPAGLASGIFRFFPDPAANERYLKEGLQNVFWYLKGISVKPGAGEVLAEHPTDLGPDGKKAPLLVAGRYGAGRTLFSAIDDSWRFRYYTGESVFDTYWVQQVRMLARGRKLGQRLFTLAPGRTTYELGQTVNVSLRLLDGQAATRALERIDAEILADDGQVIRREQLSRRDDQPDTYVGNWPADRTGRQTVKVAYVPTGVPGSTTGGEAAFDIIAPRLELADARTDRSALERLAGETLGKSLKLADVGQLPSLLPSVAKATAIESSRPLWDAPVVMALFVLLITAEWVLRKLWGMV